MAKANKGSTMSRLHSAARLSRTALATRLLAHGFYAGQDQIMIALSHEDGQTPGQLALRLGVRPPTITKTINRLQAQGFLDKKDQKTLSKLLQRVEANLTNGELVEIDDDADTDE